MFRILRLIFLGRWKDDVWLVYSESSYTRDYSDYESNLEFREEGTVIVTKNTRTGSIRKKYVEHKTTVLPARSIRNALAITEKMNG